MQFWDQRTEPICEALGQALAQYENLCLLTGGVTGVPKAVSHSFWRSQPVDSTSHIYHLQPQGFNPWDYGKNIVAGSTMTQRRWLLAQLAPVYILLSGGPGTDQEAKWALANGATIIPVGVTGGCSEVLYRELTQSTAWMDDRWQTAENLRHWYTLGNKDASVAEIVAAIYALSCYVLDNN